MFLWRGGPCLLSHASGGTSRVLAWTPQGYAALPAPWPAAHERVHVLTPPSILAVLADGYQPTLHATYWS